MDQPKVIETTASQHTTHESLDLNCRSVQKRLAHQWGFASKIEELKELLYLRRNHGNKAYEERVAASLKADHCTICSDVFPKHCHRHLTRNSTDPTPTQPVNRSVVIDLFLHDEQLLDSMIRDFQNELWVYQVDTQAMPHIKQMMREYAIQMLRRNQLDKAT